MKSIILIMISFFAFLGCTKQNEQIEECEAKIMKMWSLKPFKKADESKCIKLELWKLDDRNIYILTHCSALFSDLFAYDCDEPTKKIDEKDFFKRAKFKKYVGASD
jgi:hypothetical protein